MINRALTQLKVISLNNKLENIAVHKHNYLHQIVKIAKKEGEKNSLFLNTTFSYLCIIGITV